MLYAEFADVNNPAAWNFAPDQIEFYELYNVTSDYWMVDNIYDAATAEQKKEWGDRLQAAIKCRGATECHNLLR